MIRSLGAVVLVLGLLLLLGGIAAPATETHRSVACVDSTYGAADGCVESTFETPNFGKGAMIGLGLMTVVVGGGMVAVGGDTDTSPTADRPSVQSPSNQQEGTLASRIEQQNDGADAPSSDENRPE